MNCTHEDHHHLPLAWWSGRHFQKEVTVPNPTLNELIDAYLADRRNPFAERKCKTPESLASHIKAPRALWGAMPIEEFRKGSRARVREAVEVWRTSGLSAHTVRKRVSILKTVFRFAIDEELISREQEPVIKLPANGAPRERYVDQAAELPRLLAAADASATPLHTRLTFYLLLLTGPRVGAVKALRWEHIDFDRRVIRYRDTEAADERSKKRRGNKPMNEFLFGLLQHAYDDRDEGCEHVVSWRGEPVKNPYVGLKALFRRAGLPDLRIHDLRRTSATYVNLALEGDLQAAANHIDDTLATAKKHYVQSQESTLLRGVDAVTGLVDQARTRGVMN